MTLEAAQKIVYRELGIWTEGQICQFIPGGKHREIDRHLKILCLDCRGTFPLGEYHDIPMPPLDDGLLAVILRRLAEHRIYCTIRPITQLFPSPKSWEIVYECSIVEIQPKSGTGKGADPVAAAVMAFAEYLEARNAD